MFNISNMRILKEEGPKGKVSKEKDQPRNGHSLETFIGITNEPTLWRHQHDYPPIKPITYILSLLPAKTRLALRLVSRKIKIWTDTAHSPLQHLRLTFPLSHYILHDVAAFQALASHCTHLTVKLEPSKTELPDTRAEKQSPLKLTHLTSLTDLVIIAPMYDEWFPLVAFRMALQGAMAVNLRCVTISPVTMVGMTALRWGPFTSYGQTDWAGPKVWRGLTRLEVGLLPWWRDTYVKGDGKNGNSGEWVRVRKPVDQWRTGVKVLHDWLASFASSERIETLKLWWYELEGPNPMLLHSVAAREGDPKWHGVKATTWRGLKYLWLDKCTEGMTDVIGIRRRCKDLEELWVEDQWIPDGVTGTPIFADGAWWVKVWLGFDIEEEIKKLEAGKKAVDLEVEEKEAEEDKYHDIGPSDINLADIEERYVNEVESNEYLEYGGPGDHSMEVPLILDV